MARVTRTDGDRLRWLWLIYLVFFLMGPILYAPPRYVLYSILGIAVFLPLYFVAPRIEPGWKMLGPILGMIALGLAFVNHNPGASVFFVYAAAECPRLGPRRRALGALGLLMLLVLVVAFTWQENPFFGVPAVALVAVVGVANLHQREMNRAQGEIRRSREEIERLARIAERERIARDLHDLLGHTLSLVVLKSELARKLAERDPGRAIREIGEVEAVARQALSEVRAAVTAYRAESFQGEIDNARSALDAAGVTLEVDLEPVRLPPQHEGVLALALREAVDLGSGACGGSAQPCCGGNTCDPGLVCSINFCVPAGDDMTLGSGASDIGIGLPDAGGGASFGPSLELWGPF